MRTTRHQNQTIRFHASREHIQRETDRIKATWDENEYRRRSLGTKALLEDGLPQPVETKEFKVRELILSLGN